MNAQRMKYLGELQLLASVRKITNSQKWDFFVENNNISSDGDLIGTIYGVLTSLKKKNYFDAKIQALMVVVYLTSRIVDTRELLRGKMSDNIFECNLEISLELPGENVNGLSFKWPKKDSQVGELDIVVLRYITLIEDELVKYSLSPSIVRSNTLTMTLLPLSSLYSILIELLINSLIDNWMIIEGG